MVRKLRRAPDRGDLVFIDFTPHAGHEQAGRRPVLIVSPRAYNEKTGLCLACPVTNRVKDYPFEVPLPEESGVTGVILADHIKSLDWRARAAEIKSQVPPDLVGDVLGRLATLLA